MINLSSGQLKIIKSIGYPSFFICCYFLFLAMTFPAERFLPIAEAKLTEVLGRQVTISDLSISPFGSVSLTGVAIEVPQDENAQQKTGEKSRAAKKNGAAPDSVVVDTDSDDKNAAVLKPIVPKYHIDEMNLRVGIWSLLFGDLDVEVDADFLGGNILVKYNAPLSSDEADDDAEPEEMAMLTPAERVKLARERREKDKAAAKGNETDSGNAVSFSVVATDLNLIQFWDLKDLLPLPMFGTLDFGIELKTTTGKMADAEGKMWVDGRKISLGEGQSKVEVIDGMGPMTVDSFAIQSLLMEMNVNEGKCSFGKVQLVSNDLAATAQGDIQFVDPMSRSRLNLYFTFKLLEGYAQKSPTAQTLVSLMPGALSRAKRTDGFFGYSYRGVFKNAKFMPQKFFSGAVDRGARTTASARRSTRPAPRNRSAARPVPSRPSSPPTAVNASPAPAPAPAREMIPPPPLPDPEPDPALLPSKPSVNIREMSDMMEERQAESERKRMEATIKAQRKAIEAAKAEAEADAEQEEGDVEETGEANAEVNVEVEGNEGEGDNNSAEAEGEEESEGGEEESEGGEEESEGGEEEGEEREEESEE